MNDTTDFVKALRIVLKRTQQAVLQEFVQQRTIDTGRTNVLLGKLHLINEIVDNNGLIDQSIIEMRKDSELDD